MSVLSIVMKVYEEHGDAGRGVGSRWYSVVFLVYSALVKHCLLTWLIVRMLCDGAMLLPL